MNEAVVRPVNLNEPKPINELEELKYSIWHKINNANFKKKYVINRSKRTRHDKVNVMKNILILTSEVIFFLLGVNDEFFSRKI